MDGVFIKNIAALSAWHGVEFIVKYHICSSTTYVSWTKLFCYVPTEVIMNGKNSLSLNWMSISGVLVILGLLAGCTAVGTGSNVAQGVLQLDNGIVKIKNQNGELEPVAADSAFELVGTLESVEPWKVAGRALQRNEATQIAQGLKVGDLVRVRGAVLQDGSWLAYSIEPAKQATNQTVTLIGQVTSTNPWVVNGLPLNVTNDTVVN